MGIAILPAQDCFGSYNGRQNRLPTNKIYERVNSPDSRRDFFRSRRKTIGISPDSGRRSDAQEFARSHHFENSKLDFEGFRHSLNFIGADGLVPGDSSSVIWLSPSPSNRSANISILPRQASMPPVLDAGRGSLYYSSISNGRGSLHLYSSTAESVHQSFSTRHCFRVANCSAEEDIVYLEVEGTGSSLQEKISCSSSFAKRQSLKPRGRERIQSELDEIGKKNSMRGRTLSNVPKVEGHSAARKDALFNRKTVEQPGKNIVMEKVTILKRGETMNSVQGKEFDAESRTGGGLPDNSDDKDNLQTVGTRSSIFKKNKPVWASKMASKVFCDETKGSQADKFMDSVGGNLPKKKDDHVIMSTECLGPDPSALPKEGSGILGCSSTGMNASEAIGNGLQVMLKEFQSLNSVDCLKNGSPSGSDHLRGWSSPDFQLEKWAGPAYSNSPPPSSLPFPKFSMQQARSIAMDLVEAGESPDAVPIHSASAPVSIVQENKTRSATPVTQSCVKTSHFGVDTSATRDLRRLLHLE